MRKHILSIRVQFLLPRFTVFFLIFFLLICLLFLSRADIIYLDENGNTISSEKTEYDANGNIIVIPSDKPVEESAASSGGVEEVIVTPSHGAEDEIVYANGENENLDLNYGGISVISDGNTEKVILHRAPPNAVNLIIPDGVTEIKSGAFLGSASNTTKTFTNCVNNAQITCLGYYKDKELTL